MINFREHVASRTVWLKNNGVTKLKKQQDATLTFIGKHPASGDPICGIVTAFFDIDDSALSARVISNTVVEVSNKSIGIQYKVPDELTKSMKEGIALYVANVGGSEEAMLVKVFL